ncbi:MAG: YbfB/YjiJ family MFS transporter [Chloroflexi bacterium]|nr:YbfB/YjiJ family MFS transporter [Chloroflexota bacterium]
MYGEGWRRPARDTPPAARAAVVLGVATQCTVVGLARFGFGLLLPSMRADMEAGYAAMGAVATAGFLGHMAGSLLAGVVAVRRGSRPVLVGALALAGLATIATGSATSVLAAGLWQLLAGTGGGGAIVAGHGLVMGWFTPHRRGIATGIVVGGGGLGLLASGLLLPPVLAAGPDAWRIGWVVLGAPALFAAAAAAVVGRDAPAGRAAPAAIRQRSDLFAERGGRPEPGAEERGAALAGAAVGQGQRPRSAAPRSLAP